MAARLETEFSSRDPVEPNNQNAIAQSRGIDRSGESRSIRGGEKVGWKRTYVL